ncbi:hypothetical protein cgp_2934 [Corynebacterium glutamicum MB001]|uniref:Uncharacterized protein n=1 Tax=Corynebacterium glutamicum (strain ATCC 13032 / DSM 20300 / JCM 1318 / BCRC 11384 / CCUG 27702 / LMG 3730 / NBRC 12168 / NCIMB 10025 / NRRL B-2784 / 534) TaxID=196627 RepID=Q8NMC9_CORGL|nr:hypothetical protein cgp_2934 [Corynebacterium glutamicum MB001]ASW14965.1 hypothetical protein cgc1_2934 [Corynebacterium glutamicum]QYO74608.1 hypothetical protein cgisf_2934 [Corynebacterium glutamicum]BAC00043.1 Hypothetical protein [Corynebacterium glutamicum ATCC 13032]
MLGRFWGRWALRSDSGTVVFGATEAGVIPVWLLGVSRARIHHIPEESWNLWWILALLGR